jgi:hypothetical protein
MMDESQFRFVWHVDQAGYTIELDEPRGLGAVHEYLVCSRGGPLRSYWPLDEDGLWLRFAETCKTPEGVLGFVNEFGLLTQSPERLDSILETAALIRRIAEHFHAGERAVATKLFAGSGMPTLKEAILWSAESPGVFEACLVPLKLRDALLHQACEAITGNRRFRRCRNEGCPNWFRLGPHADTGEGRRTYTVRRQFCSDRCRVASARHRKREEATYA